VIFPRQINIAISVILFRRIKLQTPVWRCSGSLQGSSGFALVAQRSPRLLPGEGSQYPACMEKIDARKHSSETRYDIRKRVVHLQEAAVSEQRCGLYRIRLTCLIAGAIRY